MHFDCIHDLQQYVHMYFRINNGTETYLTAYPQHLQKQQPGEEGDYENIVVVNLGEDSEI